ncbi:MAG: quinone-dependent dihydroorotate dehydrogenase [Pseudomonadota bacterium]
MLNGVFDLARPMLLAFEAERAHEMTLQALERGLHPANVGSCGEELAVQVMGLDFPNPVGIAAGFDKDARVFSALHKIGFGFSEIGTVTPLPQQGNPKPRIFRLINDRAVINRLGFNNQGHDHAFKKLSGHSGGGIIGVNIGANKDAADMVEDYVTGIQRFYDLASYFMVNISSPNTPGLRDLQAPKVLDDLLARVLGARDEMSAQSNGRRVPVAVKIAPDVAEEDLPAICERFIDRRVDAVAVSNTTLARPARLSAVQREVAGGLSGEPLFRRSTAMLARVYKLTNGAVPLIGIGGISSGETALQKIEAGASLIQLYTGMVYEGPSLVGRITSALQEAAQEAGVQSIGELSGRRNDEWSEVPLAID